MTQDRWLSDLHWRRPSQQTRSERTQTALMDAAEALIVEKGPEATSIADIAQRAKCSVGTVYHHFKDKKALYYALFHRMTQEYADFTRRASDPALWEGATVQDLLRGYVGIMLSAKEQAGNAKAAVAAVIADQPALRAHVAELQADGRRALRDRILSRRDDIGHPEPEQAVGFFIDQMGAMLFARSDASQRVASIARLEDAVFMEEVLTLARRYLRLKPEG